MHSNPSVRNQDIEAAVLSCIRSCHLSRPKKLALEALDKSQPYVRDSSRQFVDRFIADRAEKTLLIALRVAV